MSARKSVPYRLGIDIGTNSLGWCVFDLGHDGRPRGIRRLGVRIFPDGRDPQSGASLAQDRRLPRGQRRRRDRYLDRRADLMHALVRHGLMPEGKAARKALESLDPYELRARGLDEPLPLHHLGRALFHLNQRRGFKSNRKTDRPADSDKDKEVKGMKDAIRVLDRQIAEARCRTLGEYLYRTAREGRSVRGSKDGSVERMRPVRARPHREKGRNAYDFYPSREMYRAEFEALWQAQAAHHPLTDAARDEIRDIVFFQRPLKPVDPGKCALDPTDRRAPLALPIVQHFRILQELANLRIEDPVKQSVRRLSMGERDKLFAILKAKDKLTFVGIRRQLGLSSDTHINLEDQRRPELKGDFVSAKLAADKCFGQRWLDAFDEARQTEILSELLDEPDEEAIVEKAMREWGLSEEQARATSAVPLPDGHGRIGLRALRKIVPIMLNEADPDGRPLHYSEAAARAGYDHALLPTGEVFDTMPYYGLALSRYVAEVKAPNASPDERVHGRIANPTVHIGLNQVRKLVNALIDWYGSPAEIVVELARDLKLSHDEKDRIKKEQTENKKKNDARRQKLEELGMLHRADGLLRLRLWEELAENPADRRCIYTGEQISVERLFGDEVEVDHILPFQDSLDDSPANLTVCMRRANRDKRKRSPHDAFGAVVGYDWDEIAKRSASLPPNKRWRFRPDAMDLLRDRTARDMARAKQDLPAEAFADIERAGGFLARQLIDTAYLARVARQYLWTVCNPNNVWVIPGRMTEFMRRKWGLNRLLYGNRPDPDDDAAPGLLPKRRDDHRHHAIDAFVVGLTDRSMLQAVSTAAGRSEERLIEDMPEPWPTFRDELKDGLDRLIVSHKPEHGVSPHGRPPHTTTGRLHEETNYGIVDERTLVARKAIGGLTANEVYRVRDETLRAALIAELGDLLFDKSALESAKQALQVAQRNGDAAAVAAAQTDVDRLKQAKKRKKSSGGKDLRAALAEFGSRHDVRHIRILKPEAAYIAITGPDGESYRAVSAGDNHRVEIYEAADGRWAAELVTVFQANQPSFVPRWRQQQPAGRLIATFFKNDLVRLLVDGQERTMRVISIWERYLQLAPHHDTNLAERYRAGEFKWTFANYDKLRQLRVRKVTVDILGRVHDPGPPR